MGSRIEPMLAEDVTRAAEMSNRYPSLSARDLVHAAIAIRAGATHIVSADSAFDVLTEITRLDPLRVEEWRTDVAAS
jgi:predicted nucleic acid-binding protein